MSTSHQRLKAEEIADENRGCWHAEPVFCKKCCVYAIEQTIRQTTAATREECCRVMCPECSDGVLAERHGGHWYHLWDDDECVECEAAAIRELGESTESP